MSQRTFPWSLGSLLAAAGAIVHAGWGMGASSTSCYVIALLNSGLPSPFYVNYAQNLDDYRHLVLLLLLTKLHSHLREREPRQGPGFSASCLCFQLSNLPSRKPIPPQSSP